MEPIALLPETMAGPWRIENELGRGGMAVVYGVVHAEIGKRAALKVMHTSPSVDVSFEAWVVNRIAHRGVVDIFETGTLPDGRPYLVMERLDGVPLSVATETKLDPEKALEILVQISDVLISAHAVGILHCDLKLENVFVVDNPDDPGVPRVKVLDWGIARTSDAEGPTADGFIVGTPHYLSPEQALGDRASMQSDVYALGVMAYALFLGQLPFDAPTARAVLVKHLRASPPSPSEIWPEIPAALETLLLAMLAKDGRERPTIAQVAARLEVVRAQREVRREIDIVPMIATVKVPPLAITPRRIDPRLRFAAIGIAIAACLLGFLGRADDPQTASASTPSEPVAPAPAIVPIASIATAEPETPAPLAIAPPQPQIRARSTSARIPQRPLPVPTAPPVVTPVAPVTVTTAMVVAQYQAVGQELQALQTRQGADAGALWQRYRMIQILDAVASPENRDAASTTLSRIAADAARLASVVSSTQ